VTPSAEFRLSALRTDLETPTGAAEKKENLSFNPVGSSPLSILT